MAKGQDAKKTVKKTATKRGKGGGGGLELNIV